MILFALAHFLAYFFTQRLGLVMDPDRQRHAEATGLLMARLRQFYVYARDGDYENVHGMLNENIVDPDGRNSIFGYQPPVVWAAREGNLELIHILVISHGANVNILDFFGETALMAACGMADMAMVDWLIHRGGADMKLRSRFGDTALMKSFGPPMDDSERNDGWGKVARFLLEQNRDDVFVRDDMERIGALHIACLFGELDLAKDLLHFAKVDIHQEDHGEFEFLSDSDVQFKSGTPFEFACVSDVYSSGLITMLLRQGADWKNSVKRFVQDEIGPLKSEQRDEIISYFVNYIQPYRAFRDSVLRGVVQQQCIWHNVPDDYLLNNIRGFAGVPACTATEATYIIDYVIKPLRQLHPE